MISEEADKDKELGTSWTSERLQGLKDLRNRSSILACVLRANVAEAPLQTPATQLPSPSEQSRCHCAANSSCSPQTPAHSKKLSVQCNSEKSRDVADLTEKSKLASARNDSCLYVKLSGLAKMNALISSSKSLAQRTMPNTHYQTT